jgi:hypothetical protein
MADIFPVDYDTPLGQLRALTSQTKRYKDPANPTLPDAFLIPDDQLNAYLAIAGGKLYKAAADTLRALSANEALVSKKIRTEDLSTDGPAVAAQLRLLADEYDARQKDEDEAADALDAFEIVDYTSYPSNWPLR